MQITERTPATCSNSGVRLTASVLPIGGIGIAWSCPRCRDSRSSRSPRSRGIAKSTVEYWAYAYRDRDIEAWQGKVRAGRTARITGEQARRLKQRIDAGPLASDGGCTLRGKDIQRIARGELGVSVGLSSVYRTLERMGCSCPAPRPRHENQNLATQRDFRDNAAPPL